MSSAAMLVANEMESMVVKNLEGASDDVSAMLLVKMKEPAETYLGGEVNNAVVTVPAYSMIPSVRPPGRRNYRKARHDVIIDELTAAAIHMAWTSGQLGGSVLVYDMGKVPSTRACRLQQPGRCDTEDRLEGRGEFLDRS